MNGLIPAVHEALNATAIPRRPDPALLPPAVGGGWQALGPARCLEMPLEDALVTRRSRYAFGLAQPSAPDIAALLLTGVWTAPRAGGLPSVTPYLVVRAPGHLAVGVHRADLRHPLPGLATTREGDPTQFIEESLEQPQFARRVPLWVAFTVDTAVGVGRYPERHYRTLHLDAGVALQNLLLVATALGLASCPVMGYDDAAWGELLTLAETELVAGIVAVG